MMTSNEVVFGSKVTLQDGEIAPVAPVAVTPTVLVTRAYSGLLPSALSVEPDARGWIEIANATTDRLAVIGEHSGPLLVLNPGVIRRLFVADYDSSEQALLLRDDEDEDAVPVRVEILPRS